MDAESRKFIQDEIKKAINIILSGQSGENNQETETISDMYPGMPPITKRPIMHPFGFASRAALGTIQVVGKQGEHAGNRLILGHRDKTRPADLVEGETVIYSSDGKTALLRIDVQKAKITIGSKNAAENLVLGKTYQEYLVKFLGNLLDTVSKLIEERLTDSTHNHLGFIGIPTSTPIQTADMVAQKVALENLKAQLESLKAEYIDSKIILSDKSFTEK